MTSRLLRVLLALLMYGVVGLSLPDRSSAAPEERVTADRVQDRLVWAAKGQGLRNLHIRTSRADGTGGVTEVYDNPRGFTLALVPSPNRRRVAFVTCCSSALPLLVVAPTKGGPHLEPLKDHPELEAADAVAWSPDGTHLAFRAVVQEGEQRVASIWTIGVDGTDLQHVLTIGDVVPDDAPVVDDSMVWTDDGILFVQDGELRRARDGMSTLVMSRVRSVQASGDGRRLVLVRVNALSQQVWLARSDGTRARRVLRWDLNGGRWLYLGVAANHDGSRLLAYRLNVRDVEGREGWIAWDTEKGPRSHEWLPVRKDASAVTLY